MTDRSHAALMLEHVLALMSWETERPVDDLKDDLRSGNHAVHSGFRYTLARIVARELGTLVRAVYVYGSPMENRARQDSDIDLLVVVNGKRRYARRRLEELDRNLVEEYHTLIAGSDGPPVSSASPGVVDALPESAAQVSPPRSMDYLLDFHLVTRDDIRRHKGYAAILTDPYALTPELIFEARRRRKQVA